MTDDVAAPRAARQLRPERAARRRPQHRRGDDHRPRPHDHGARGRGRARPRHRVPALAAEVARRAAAGEGLTLTGAGRPGRLRQDRARPRTWSIRRCPTNPGSSRRCAATSHRHWSTQFGESLLEPPAGSRDHDDGRGQRHGQPRPAPPSPTGSSKRPGSGLAEVARAYSVVREIFDLESLWGEIEALDGIVDHRCPARRLSRDPPGHRPGHPLAGRRALPDQGRRRRDRPLRSVHCRPWRRSFRNWSAASRAPRSRPTPSGWSRRGCRGSWPRGITELLSAFLLLDVVEIALAEQQPPTDVAALHYALSNRFSVDEMLTKITALPRDDRWSALARAALRHDVYAALKAITSAVLRETEDGLVPRRADRGRGSTSTAPGSIARRPPWMTRSVATTSTWPPCRWRFG